MFVIDIALELEFEFALELALEFALLLLCCIRTICGL